MAEQEEPWEKSVPADLIPAVKYLRKSFDDAHWGCGHTTQKFCYALLHNEQADDPANEYFNYFMQTKARVGVAATQRFHDLLKQGTPPAIFKAFLDLYLDGISVEALRIFHELTEIGRANQGRLGVPFLEWAEAQTTSLVRAHSHLIKIWIRDVCDKQVYDPNDGPDELYLWRKWQAPKFILMKPSRGQPYDSATTWERYDSETSSRFLDAFTRDYMLSVESRLREAFGKLALAVAKERPQTPAKPAAPADPSSQTAAVNEDSPTMRCATPVPEHGDPDFSHTEDYCSVRFKGKEHPLTPRQATIVRLLHRAYLSGYANVPKGTLLSAIEAETSEVRDSFRGSPLWKTLVRSGSRKGTYRLALRHGEQE